MGFGFLSILTNITILLLFVTAICGLCIPVKDISISNKVVVENDVLFSEVTQAYSGKRNPSVPIRSRT